MIAKRTYLIVALLFLNSITSGVLAQSIKEKSDQIKGNFDVLSKDRDYTSSIFSIGKDKIQVKNPLTDEIEFILYNNEIDMYLSLFDSLDYHEIQQFYLKKGKSKFNSKQSSTSFIPESNRKIRVAIDPGHHAGTMREAVYEDRYVKYRFDSANQDTFINESGLNFDIAYLLQKKLEKAGYETMLTRNFGTSAVYMSFDDWMQEEYIYAIRNLMANDEISIDQANDYLESKDRKVLFNNVYSYIDFKERAKRINAFNPDLTIVIHLNAFEYGKRDDDGYSNLTDSNYSMSFVPGAFLNGELDKLDQRIDFLRLLVSDNLDKSIFLGDMLLEEAENILNVPRHSQDILSSQMVNNYSIDTGYKGLYARNLYMTRAIESPIIFGELLLQDNFKEFKRLATVDFIQGNVRTSKRVDSISLCYFNSIQRFFKKY